MKQNSILSKQPLIERNQKKISNWLQFRKDDYLLKARDISEIEKIREEYISETDFMQKIALKKQIEILEEEKRKLIETFHDEMTELERAADEMQKEFEDSVLKLPQLIIKIVIKF